MIGIMLAGGQARRLGGGDKGRHLVGYSPMLARIIASLRPQCSSLVISANGDTGRFASYGLPVVSDSVAICEGPLAGLLAGLDFAAIADPEGVLALTVPTDTPFLPLDLVSRLATTQESSGASVVCARSGGRCHSTAAIWRIDLRDDLRRVLSLENVRQVGLFAKRHACVSVEWGVEPYDPFFNVNTPADLDAARLIASTITLAT